MTEDDKKRLMEIARGLPEDEIYVEHQYMDTTEVADAIVHNGSFIESHFIGWIDDTVVFGDVSRSSLIVVRFKSNIPTDEMEINFVAKSFIRNSLSGIRVGFDLVVDITRKEVMKW